MQIKVRAAKTYTQTSVVLCGIVTADTGIDSAKAAVEPLGEELAAMIRDTPISHSDVVSMYDYIGSSMDMLKTYLRELSYIFFAGDVDMQAFAEYLTYLKQVSVCDKDLIMVGANSIFTKINRSSSKQFRNDMIPYLIGLDGVNYEWSYSDDELTERSEVIFGEYESAMKNMYGVYLTASCGRATPGATGKALGEEINEWTLKYVNEPEKI